MVRGPTYDENGIKKGAWSKEEDDKLRAYILKYGHWNWRELPKFAGVCRSGKSCRLRWVNYLRPDLKHGNYTKEEEDIIIKLHEEHGNKWSLIASKLPGRTDNEIKNHWHHLRKRKNKDQVSIMEEHSNETNQIGEAESQSPNLADIQLQESSPLSTSSYHEVNNHLFGDSSGDFWTDPFVLSDDYAYNQNNYSSSSFPNGEPTLSNDSFYEDSLDPLYYIGQLCFDF